jgi:pimeloyl-ACP methyl ester carboxylesterase
VYTEHLHISVGPGVMHVERTGRGGPAVLLLHGFGSCAFLWRAVAPALAAAGFTVLAPDLLGFGESERPAGASYSPAAQAAYLERLLTSLRVGEVQLVGQDLGALVGLLLAAEHPLRTQRLALLEPLDPGDLPGPAIRTLQRTSALAALGANALFGVRPLLEPLLSAAVGDPSLMSDRLVARYLAPFVGGDGMGELLQLASAVTLSEEEQRTLSQISAEVLIWSGVESTSLPNPTERWDRWLPRARVTPILSSRPAGTLVAEDDATALIAALRSWLT